jgi:hypothetical protein
LFAVSLCFSGLEPLWKTKAATASLLAGCVALVLLINAAFQEGDEGRPVHIILRWSAYIACGLTLIFSILAAYSLYLRLSQYGLTPERVVALVGVVVAVLYGLGYSIAALWPKGWLRDLKWINIALAFIMALICLCVLTPVADPYRLSAQSQAERVDSGQVAPDKFDWDVLRFETGSYGREELKRLIKSGKTETIRKAAASASQLMDSHRYDTSPTPTPATRKALPGQFDIVLPKDAVIPADFLAQAFEEADHLPSCATEGEKCFAALLDLDHDDSNEIVILNGLQLTTFTRHDGQWLALTSSYLSNDDAQDFKAGRITTLPNRYDNVRIGGRTVHLDDRAANAGIKDFVDLGD